MLVGIVGPLGSTQLVEEEVCDGKAGFSPGRPWPVWLSWGRALLSFPVRVFLEEDKEAPLHNRKNHFMKLCNALGPVGGWVTGCSTQEESYAFHILKEDTDRHHRSYSALNFPQNWHHRASCGGRKSFRLTCSKVTVADISSVTLYFEH